MIDALKAGNLVLYDREIAAIMDRDTPEGRAIIKVAKQSKHKVCLDEKDGVFVMPAWVIPPSQDVSNGKPSF